MEIPGILIAIFNFILAVPKLLFSFISFLLILIFKSVLTIIFFIINIGGGIYNLIVYIFPFKEKKYFNYLTLKKKGESNG